MVDRLYVQREISIVGRKIETEERRATRLAASLSLVAVRNRVLKFNFINNMKLGTMDVIWSSCGAIHFK